MLPSLPGTVFELYIDWRKFEYKLHVLLIVFSLQPTHVHMDYGAVTATSSVQKVVDLVRRKMAPVYSVTLVYGEPAVHYIVTKIARTAAVIKTQVNVNLVKQEAGVCNVKRNVETIVKCATRRTGSVLDAQQDSLEKTACKNAGKTARKAAVGLLADAPNVPKVTTGRSVTRNVTAI